MPTTNSAAIHNLNELDESGLGETFHQSFFDFYPGIIYVYDANKQKLRFVNKKISEVLGFSNEDLSQWDHDLMKLVYAEDVDFLKNEFTKYNDLQDEKSHSHPCRFNQKAGGWMHFEITGKVLQRNPDGKPALFLFMAHDVSGYMQAKEELKNINEQIREREELLTDYNERMDVKEKFLQCGSWRINVTSKVITWSDGMYYLFGYDPKKDRAGIVVNEDLYRSHIAEIDFEKFFQFNDYSLKEEEAGFNREYEITTGSGEKKRVETFAKIVRDENKNPKWIVGTTQNITRLRNSEMESEESIRELKNSVTNLEEFTYIASHDIQEPLRKITTFSEQLKAKYATDLNDEARGYLDRIMKTSFNAHQLIDGLMSFLQLDHQHQHFRKTDMNVVLEEVKEELELKLDKSATTINSKNLPTIEIIPQQIKQLLTNMISNALKFRNPGQLVIDIDSIKLRPDEVQAHRLNASIDYYKISIKDNGVGFVNESTGKMFQMFQRFHSKSKYAGSGIGLAICKKIVDKHNGLIAAVGNPGEGAVFSIVLPAVQIKEDAIHG